jgi:MurNAc alpha-1-phosphate uridylyltransferase
MQCVVLAGGLGTRMRPFTDRAPKVLVPVEGKPFCAWQLAWITARGVDDIVMCVGRMGEQVVAAVGDRANGVRVRYVHDGEAPVGTGGALRRALDEGALNDEFLVMYGDSFLPIDLRPVAEAFRAQERPAMMVVFRNEGRYDKSNVLFEDGVVGLYQKTAEDELRRRMKYIDYGVSAFRREVIETRIPRSGPYDLAQLQHELSTAGLLAGLESQERFFEVGSHEGLAAFTEWIRDHGGARGLQ